MTAYTSVIEIERKREKGDAYDVNIQEVKSFTKEVLLDVLIVQFKQSWNFTLILKLLQALN